MAESKSKRKKLSRKNKKLVLDRISDLPECLLIDILSFLPTQKAMATSVLSTRWKHLWTLVPKLDIPRRTTLDPRDDLSRVFDQNKTPYLRTCNLTYRFCPYRTNLVKRWTINVVARKLEELDLDIYNGDDSWSWLKEAGLDFNKDDESLKLPHRVFYCKTLVVSKFHGKIRIDVPSSSSFQFPSLKKLGLFRLVYKSDSLFRLLSACHVLEDLTFEREYGDGVFDYKICIPMLKRLSVDFEVCEYIGHELIPYDDYKLEMKTPALEYFKFNGHLREVVFLQKLDNLVQADVNICTFEEKDHRQEEQCYADRVSKILAALYNVKFLSFYSRHSECLSNGSTYPLRFQNLVRLEFKVNAWNWHVLQALLQNSPNLEVLDVTKMKYGFLKHKLCWKESPNVLDDLSSCLTTFYFRDIYGSDYEMEFLKYILKEARGLKTTTISVGNIKLKESILKDLSMIPRRSMTCLLKVTDVYLILL